MAATIAIQKIVTLSAVGNRVLLPILFSRLREADRGDAEAAAKRLFEPQGMSVLSVDEHARDLARQFLERKLIPAKATSMPFTPI